MMRPKIIAAGICSLIAVGDSTLFPQAPPQDDPVKALVSRLDIEKYKATIKSLAQFGDRREGTESNRKAMEWIKAQLESYRCLTDRIKYVYTPGEGGLRDQLFCTKAGTTASEETYIVGAHMDGQGGGEAADDNASGAAIVMELARIFSMPDVETERSIRFVLWNNQETGYQGARAYVDQRREMQGKEDYPGSGNYPEPRWLALIDHDMVLWDHGIPRAGGSLSVEQRSGADINIEYEATSASSDQALKLAGFFRDANAKYATDYPAAVNRYMGDTEVTPFMGIIPTIVLRASEREMQAAGGGNPHRHKPTDIYSAYSDLDFRLGLNAAQTTLGAVSQLAGTRLKK